MTATSRFGSDAHNNKVAIGLRLINFTFEVVRGGYLGVGGVNCLFLFVSLWV